MPYKEKINFRMASALSLNTVDSQYMLKDAWRKKTKQMLFFGKDKA